MKNKSRLFIYIFSIELLLQLTSLISASGMALRDSIKISTGKEKKGKWLFLPIVLYSPEESLILGAGAIHLFKFKNEDSLTRQSNIQGSVLYTLAHQFVTEPSYCIFTNKEKYIIKGITGFSRFPYYYWGVGNNTLDKNKELISYDVIKFDNSVYRKIKRKLYAGIGFRYYNMFKVESDISGVLETTKTAGYKGSVAAGPEVALLYDTRNNVLNSTKGWYLSIINTAHGHVFGGNFNFNKLVMDARKFISPFLRKKQTIALQTFIQYNSGNSPFNELGLMGGPMIMRGYYLGHYRDNILAAMQVEYRVKIKGRFGMAAFLSTGEVAGKITNFSVPGLKAAYGAGLRINVSKKDNLNLRLDYGLGNGPGLIYFAVAESF
jgi:outer membrane translocation and assembly module TamA